MEKFSCCVLDPFSVNQSLGVVATPRKVDWFARCSFELLENQMSQKA